MLQTDKEGVQHVQGILPSQELARLMSEGHISSCPADRLQPNSIDLKLGPRCWRLHSIRTPRKSETVAEVIAELAIEEMDLGKPRLLERGAAYLAELSIGLKLPPELGGHSDSKSSTGRLDIQTRLLADRCERYDLIPRGYSGKLYLFISSNSFLIRLRAGICLNQIRVSRGEAILSDSELPALLERGVVQRGDELLTRGDIEINDGFILTLDLQSPIAAYRARSTNAVVDLARTDNPQEEFWERIPGGKDQLTLEKGQFYILSTRETVAMPATHCAWIPPFRPDFGEFRSHYAGFFDSGFRATTTLEVRSQDNSLTLVHGAPVSPLVLLRLAAPAAKLYSAQNNTYQGQSGPRLSKYFR